MTDMNEALPADADREILEAALEADPLWERQTRNWWRHTTARANQGYETAPVVVMLSDPGFRSSSQEAVDVGRAVETVNTVRAGRYPTGRKRV